MYKRLFGSALAGALLFAATPASAQFFAGPCSQDEIQKTTDEYIQAQSTGDVTPLPLGEWVDYQEQGVTASMGTGIISTPQKIDFHRSIYDPDTCSSFTEVIITDPKHPYVLGTVLHVRGGRVGGIETLVTDKGDWLFNAASTLKYSKAENWGEIPPAERDSRETLMAAANAYLDLFNNKNTVVPWGTPCARLEGGMYTGKGAPGTATPQDSCNVGVPSGVALTNRRYVVDQAHGAVAVQVSFGNDQLPDIHTFRIEHGKIRYVHTITVCKTFNCGFPMPKELATQ